MSRVWNSLAAVLAAAGWGAVLAAAAPRGPEGAPPLGATLERSALGALSFSKTAYQTAVHPPVRTLARPSNWDEVHRFLGPAAHTPSSAPRIALAPPTQFSALSDETLRNLRLPLLAPFLPEARGRLGLDVGEDAYSVVIHLPGARVVMRGTRIETLDPANGRLARPLRAQVGSPGGVLPALRTHYVLRSSPGRIELAFSKFRASYSVTVDCSAPQGDVRCTEDGFVRELANGLRLANPPSPGITETETPPRA